VIELDVDARTLTFRKNDDKEAIGTVTDIERGEYYRVAVAMATAGDTVSFA